MRIRKLAVLALAAELVYGYLDTSPFFMFSTSELLTPTAQLQSATSLTADVAHIISQCPSNVYVLVTQPGVTASMYTSPRNAPELARYMTADRKASIRSSSSITDVAGALDTNRWQDVLEKACGATTFHLDTNMRHLPDIKGRQPTLLKVSLPVPHPERPSRILKDNDLYFASVMDTIPSPNYTVLYTTTPPAPAPNQPASEPSRYEMETPLVGATHLDLKRDVDVGPGQSHGNQTIPDGPLFEKYQFLSPGIFMGFLVGIILLSILYFAITGVASLQVTYTAFDKETGQQAQKKSQ